MAEFMILLVAGLVAGAMNAAAGGGSFVTLPAMIFAGVPSVEANASSTVALFPGAIASVYAYRHDFRPFEVLSLRVMLAVSMAGGLVGALLLLVTPSKRFDEIVPGCWLVRHDVLTAQRHLDFSDSGNATESMSFPAPDSGKISRMQPVLVSGRLSSSV